MESFTTVPAGISTPLSDYPELLSVHSMIDNRLHGYSVIKSSTTMENLQIADEHIPWSEHEYEPTQG